MKRGVPLFLCFVFLFNYVGWSYIFIIVQDKIHEANWYMVSDDRVTETKFLLDKDNSFLRLNSHELLIGGKHYDIIRIEKSSDGTVYVCNDDTKEDELMLNFKNNSENDFGKGQSSFHRINSQINNGEFFPPLLYIFSCVLFSSFVFEKTVIQFPEILLKPRCFPPEV